MKAMGASRFDVQFVVLVQSIVCGVIGGARGLLAGRALCAGLALDRDVAGCSLLDVFLREAALLLLCALASLIAVRPAIEVDPGRVFRA